MPPEDRVAIAPPTSIPWNDLSPDWRHRITLGITPAIAPEQSPPEFFQPETPDQLAQILTQAHEIQRSVLVCGNGSKLDWGDSAPGIDWVLSTAKLDHLIENAAGDLTFTAEAGMTLAQAQTILAPERLFLAIDPIYPRSATLGGLIATADTGSLRHRYGGLRDMLLGIEFVRADGQRAKAGGRVVKNVAGYDLMKLFTGSYGTLGVLTQVTLRTFPRPEALRTVLLSGDAVALAKANLAIAQSNLNPIAQDWLSSELISQSGEGQATSLALRFGNLEASVIEQVEEVRSLGQSLGLQTTVLQGEPEQAFWAVLSARLSGDANDMNSDIGADPAPEQIPSTILCKFGLLPTATGETLQLIQNWAPATQVRLHGGSGLGLLRGPVTDWDREKLERLRSHCRAHSGFMTLLEAPRSLKDQLDIWGYGGNALPVMRRIKRQFDPQKS